MERQKPLGIIMSSNNYSDEQIALFDAIEDARMQLEHAREFFETVSDPKLIDYAIYMEEAAKARYTYLITEAKRLHLKIDYSYKLNNAKAV